MYSVGEKFTEIINNKEISLFVIGDMIIKGVEYLIVKDETNNQFIFLYNDTDDIMEKIDDSEVVKNLFEIWNSEVHGIKEGINLWEEDEDGIDDIMAINTENEEEFEFSIDDLLGSK